MINFSPTFCYILCCSNSRGGAPLRNDISMYFLRNMIFHFPSIRSYFRKRGISSLPIIQKDQFFLEKPSFLTICRKNNITMYLFKEDRVSFSIQRITVFISEKEITSFLVITERSSFQNFGRKYHISMYLFDKDDL